MQSPAPDQIEINLFGPGYGECIVIHLGSNKWVVIDSCIDSATKNPTALEYLDSIGVNPAEAVVLLIATHWHDDHIRGLARVAARCSSSKFCLAAAVTANEFLQTLASYDERHGIAAGSGTSEICSTLRLVRDTSRTAVRIVSNKLIFNGPAAEFAHSRECNIWGLSPSDAQFELSLREIGNLLPKVGEAKRRAPEQGCNDLSVVTWISLGDISLLFGADLEERGVPNLGWAAVVGLSGRPNGRASFFKIPHHGSQNGHFDQVWSDMLISNPITTLTPWNRGTGLPRDSDLARIRGFTNSAFSTSTFKSVVGKKRSSTVEKMLKRTAKSIKMEVLNTGHVQIRNGGNASPDIWCIETANGACHLDSLI